MASLRSKDFCVAMDTIFELEKGIELLRWQSERKGAAMAKWFRDFLASRPKIIEQNVWMARKHARLSTIPALQNLVAHDGPKGTIRVGHDLAIAVTAIAMDAYVATMDTTDFVLINEFARLPGVYNPCTDEWPVRPKNRSTGNSAAWLRNRNRQLELAFMLSEADDRPMLAAPRVRRKRLRRSDPDYALADIHIFP